NHQDLFIVICAFLGVLFLGVLFPLVPNPFNFPRIPAIYTPNPQQKTSGKVITVSVLQSSAPVKNCEASCSLEQAVQFAPDGATIVFAEGLTGTITLSQEL